MENKKQNSTKSVKTQSKTQNKSVSDKKSGCTKSMKTTNNPNPGK